MRKFIRLNGAISFSNDYENMRIMDIFGYEFNEDFNKYFFTTITESLEYKELFKEKEERPYQSYIYNPEIIDKPNFINSILEYLIIKQLSYSVGTFQSKNVTTLKGNVIRSDTIDKGVLKNRIFEILSNGIQERNEIDPKITGKVISKITGGLHYENVWIDLPEKTTLYRNNENFIEVDNPYFKIRIIPQYVGRAASVERIFCEDLFQKAKKAEIYLDITYKHPLFQKNKSVATHEWLEYFIGRINEYVSLDLYQEKMNPNQIKLIVKLLNDQKKKYRKYKKKKL